MPAQVGPGDPIWTLDVEEFETRAVTVLKVSGVTNDAQRATFVTNLNAAQQLSALQALLNCFHAKPGNT